MAGVPDRLKLMGDATRWRIVEFLAHPIRSCCSRDDIARAAKRSRDEKVSV